MRKDKPNLTFEELREKLITYITDENDLDMIRKAYMLAFEKHFGVKRKSGEDYIIHPLNVAYILTEIYADAKTIQAALLHDVVEDTDVTIEEIEEMFGSEVALLVNGVTKINRLNFQGDNEAMIANHRKILVGLTEDVRVIIIKLADRLHNMRTIWALPEKKQKQKAKETLDILTPIAHRLGIGSIKSELEDLSLRYYKPDTYFDIVEKLNKSKAERDQLVIEMKQSVSSILNEHGIKHEIKGRSKSIYSIYKKLDKGKKFSDIFDLLALRVFVDTESECYQALGIIHSKYRPIPKRFKDYVAMPKTNMYQSLHTTVFGEGGQLYEIQIRTYEMDKVAELGIASHWSYKENGSNVKANMKNTMEQKLQFFRNIMDLKQEETNDADFVKSVSEEVLKENVYVFTPKGDVIELPSGSTPIDFAYRVHSGVGDKMVGAIVNNNIVPLDYVLKDNDIIKINTNKNSIGPSREWINMAYTSSAKNKIKAFYNKIDKEGYIEKGQEILKDECRKKKIAFNEIISNENIEKILKEYKFRNVDELYVNVGNGKITPTMIFNVINNNNENKVDIILKKATNNANIKQTVNKNDIVVEGIDDIKVNIASCCKPVPGDRVIGYITKGNGISVHRSVCPNVSELEERLIEVNWNTKISKKYSTTLLIRASESKNILLDVVSKTSNSDITIQSINSLSQSKDEYVFEITVMVDCKESLVKFMNDINSLQKINSIERIIK
ncbi:MAG: bifunctional (p)ppGpp synthetase/guanosine-3',5'-bis(diphosphate) 3'-pyrophosphohydrolase [Tenericutes bacterium]|nr:bifunctional (p)ppGpp synthetase/guanosine-3',5'-bis(diphosphate) 3'-pyrophosphohydrolase [Mycoplasmatota bacterium]MDY3801299.1 bifunctional (p)ppGpp synthetase/guanosine-3',5'-bis(diphosphate) 3'-pyrophosphohydrolase [Bacilli bacterium]